MNNIQKRNQLIEIAQQACAVILKEKRESLRIYTKKDGSTVTSADHASERVIVNKLREIWPHTPVVSEEEHADGKHVSWRDHVWLVDPLDSTSGFARGSPDYSICMAEIVQGKPEWGVVAVPETGDIYVGHVTAQQVWKANANHIQELAPVVSYSEPYACVLSPTDIAARRMCVDWQVTYRGSALKFGLVAEGAADLYVRSDCLMHWDIAAGDALVQAAGGACMTHDGKPIQYVCESPHMPPFVVKSRAVRPHPLIVI